MCSYLNIVWHICFYFLLNICKFSGLFAFMFKVRKMCYYKQKSIGYQKKKNTSTRSSTIFAHFWGILCIMWCLQNFSLLLSSTFLKGSHLHSNRFLWTSKRYSRAGNKFYCFSNCLLVNLKNILELEQWTNRNKEFRQWTNRKQWGPQGSSVDISPIKVVLPTLWVWHLFVVKKCLR